MSVLDKIKQRLDELDGRTVNVTIKAKPQQGQADFRKIANAR